MNPPSFPTESLSGGTPPFPVGYVNIPNILDLPSYIFSVTTYYGDPLNYPYRSPPIIASWKIPYPNLLALPTFFEKLVLWLLGWAGAIFEWAFQWLSAEMQNFTIWGINGISGIIRTLTTTSEAISNETGIFQPVIFAFLGGLILLAIIGTIFIAINTVGKIT